MNRINQTPESPLYPSGRTFVVKFSRDSLPDAEECAGRVEHVDSGHTRRFANLDELFEFLRAVMEQPPESNGF